VSVGKDRTLVEKAFQAAGKVGAEAREIVVPELVDYDRQDQFRLGRSCWLTFGGR